MEKEGDEDDDSKAEDKTKDVDDDDDDGGDKFRDQGYTRPTVLVLLPTRGMCYRFVHQLIKLMGSDQNSGGSKEFMERFESEYGAPPDEDGVDDDGDHDMDTSDKDEAKKRRRKAVLKKKGEAWLELFGDDVNQDDDFKMGIAMTSNVAKKDKNGRTESNSKDQSSNIAVKLYSDFYKSDIIVASPLGLKLLVTPSGDDDEDDEGRNSRHRGDIDFLSSIEICLVQNADVMMMQNWDHVNDILELLNQEPLKNNDTDFSRVRNYFLEGQSKYWRQLIVSSNFIDPSIQSTFSRFGKSKSGSVKLRRRVSPEDASISSVLVPMRHVFQRVTASSLEKQSEARLSYFTKSILPQILGTKQAHTLIYIPSYFDFCSLRNTFLKRKINFVSVTEYSRISETSRGRARFIQGKKPIMLYTGRAHFFHRHAIKGAKHIIFLGLPEQCEYYADHANTMSLASDPTGGGDGAGGSLSCLSLFTRYDSHSLERVVGTSNCLRMIKSEKSTFMFHS